jgi:hypothetical protein
MYLRSVFSLRLSIDRRNLSCGLLDFLIVENAHMKVFNEKI